MAFGGVVLQLIDKCVLCVKYVFFLQKNHEKQLSKVCNILSTYCVYFV